jgi:hypothetical protein
MRLNDGELLWSIIATLEAARRGQFAPVFNDDEIAQLRDLAERIRAVEFVRSHPPSSQRARR